jgi:hypothetical protein
VAAITVAADFAAMGGALVALTPAWLSDTPTDWWTVMANGIPVSHYPPHRKDLAIQYATDPAYRALLVALAAWRQP